MYPGVGGGGAFNCRAHLGADPSVSERVGEPLRPLDDGQESVKTKVQLLICLLLLLLLHLLIIWFLINKHLPFGNILIQPTRDPRIAWKCQRSEVQRVKGRKTARPSSR